MVNYSDSDTDQAKADEDRNTPTCEGGFEDIHMVGEIHPNTLQARSIKREHKDGEGPSKRARLDADNEDDTESESESETDEEAIAGIYKRSMRVVSNPGCITELRDKLSPKQLAAVNRIGFGGLLDMDLTDLPYHMNAWIVDSFDPDSREVRLDGHELYTLKLADVWDTFLLLWHPKNTRSRRTPIAKSMI